MGREDEVIEGMCPAGVERSLPKVENLLSSLPAWAQEDSALTSSHMRTKPALPGTGSSTAGLYVALQMLETWSLLAPFEQTTKR